MEYEKTLNHFKKITSNKRNRTVGREALKGVYHSENTIRATDGHRLLKAEIEKTNFNPKILDVKSNEIIDENYPKTEHLFLTEDDIEIKLMLDPEQILGAKHVLTCIKALKYSNVELVKDGDGWYIRPQYDNSLDKKKIENVNISYRLVKDTESKEQVKLINTDYLLGVMNFIKDTKEFSTMNMTDNSMKPIQFENAEFDNFKYKYLVLPIRKW